MAEVVVADPHATVQQIIKKISNIATLPEVTSRIVQMVEDPNSSAAELHKLVSHDPALVTRILKIVNSAFYGLPGQISSIERAIVLLGLNAIKNIAVAASLGQLFRGVKICEGFTARDLWNHCIAVGITARELARLLKVPLADEAFLAGMIHDLGLLVSLQVAPDKMREVCEKAKTSVGGFCDIELEETGMHHEMLGAALCEQWKFPRSCQIVAGYHHHPATLAKDNRLLVTIVCAADTLCCAEGQGFNLTALRQNLDEPFIREAGLDAPLLDGLRAALPVLIANSASVFG